MTESALPIATTQGFVSYRRADNTDFRAVVDQFRSDVTAMYEAITGKTLRLFLDRESIGWGEDWRQRIHEAVGAATVFIPIITMRYFTSEMCREELLAFYGSASRLGVTELLLPVVLFGADQIRDDHELAEVQLIARLNYKNIEDAWVAGYDSPEWRAMISDCVNTLDRAIQGAESALASAEEDQEDGPEDSGGVTPPGGGPPAAPGGGGSDNVGDSLEIPDLDIPDMLERMEAVAPLTEEALSAMNDFAEVAGLAFEGMDDLNAQQTKTRMILAAKRLKEPALDLESAGERLETALVSLDADIRALVAVVSRMTLPTIQEQLRGMLDAFQTEDDLSEVEATAAEAIQTLDFASLMSVSLKRSLQPAVRGMRSIRSAVGIFHGWQQLKTGLA
jgi:hypothetical protein